MKYHRGTVQKQSVQTLDTQCHVGVVVDESKSAYSRNYGSKGKIQDSENVADTLQATMGEGGGNVPLVENEIKKIEISQTVNEKLENNPKCIRVGEMYGQTTRWGVYDKKGISPTLVAAMGEGGGYVPFVENTSQKLIIGNNKKEITEIPSIIQKCGDRGTNNYSVSETSYTISSNPMSDRGQLLINTEEDFKKKHGLRIRKLTPKECWRLMGFKDEEFEKAEKVNSNSQLYKQAGNSIVVNVLQKILENLLKGEING